MPAEKMRSCTSLIGPAAGDSTSCRSMPAQNDLPFPLSSTAPTPRVGLGLLERLAQRAAQFQVQRVAPVRPVQREMQDASLAANL